MRPGLLRLGSGEAPQARAWAESVVARLPVAHVLVALSLPADGGALARLAGALAEGRIDAALLPLAGLPPGLPAHTALGCVLARGDAREVLVGACGLEGLAAGARVLAGAPSTAGQLCALAPALHVDEGPACPSARLDALRRGAAAAVVVGADDLERLGGPPGPARAWEPAVLLPPPGAGAWGLLVRADDATSEGHVAALRDLRSAAAVTAERAVQARLAGLAASAGPGALAAHATCAGGAVHLVARWVARDGSRVLEARTQAALAAAAAAGEEAAQRLGAGAGGGAVPAARAPA